MKLRNLTVGIIAALMSLSYVSQADEPFQVDAEFAIVADGGGGRLDENGKAFSYTISSAEKTFASIEVTARNPGGHSSRPR
ncbi:MAG: hypothetical protein IMF06_01015 [Proteobacteria bacterium]|nr:hypothetical protein [Pseudomonadota bacterium]